MRDAARCRRSCLIFASAAAPVQQARGGRFQLKKEAAPKPNTATKPVKGTWARKDLLNGTLRRLPNHRHGPLCTMPI